MISERWRMKTGERYEVEAVHLDPTVDLDAVAEWCGGARKDGGRVDYLLVGDEDAIYGDWIVRQRSGFHVWDATGFIAAFERVPS